MVTQTLILPNSVPGTKPAQTRISPPETLFVSTGRKMYLMGDIDGRFRPCSNPYDLHAFGHPRPGDPLAERLQGLWAQPVKGLNGYAFEVERNGKTWTLTDALSFTQRFVDVRFEFLQDGLSASRTDFIPLDQAILLTTLTLKNQASRTLFLKVRYTVFFDLEDAWFTSLSGDRNQGESLVKEGDCLVARALSAPDRWAVAVGCAARDARVSVLPAPGQHQKGQFEVEVILAPGSEGSWTFGAAVESQDGAEGALKTLEKGLREGDVWREQKQKAYLDQLQAGPRLTSPDPALDRAFEVVRANMLLLEADSPALGRYLYAGLQTFPFWFSADLAYSTAGLAIAGLTATLRNALLVATRFQTEGRVPHQISPSGRIAFPGNAQETPQWVTAAWEYYCWTGDRDFLAQVYPSAVKGLMEYTLTAIDPDGDNFPSGPGIVEVEGMGDEKLDAAVYTWLALESLMEMALVMGDGQTADLARARFDQIEASFDPAWWDPTGGTYAMSLSEPGNLRLPVPHWAVITPLEVGLAAPSHAETTLRTLAAGYLNRWGLKHTLGSDERVWTLPTATLSRAAFRNERPNLGLEMLAHLAETLDQGSMGLFHELIPDGLCIVQLWSGATFLRGVVEDLLGIGVRADLKTLTIAPRLPAEWGNLELNNLAFAGHVLEMHFTGGEITAKHVSGPGVLRVILRPGPEKEKAFDLAPGDIASTRIE